MVTQKNGTLISESWYQNNDLHRVNGPACIWYYDTKVPAHKEWRINDVMHRDDGPAFINYYESGNVQDEVWYTNGQVIREKHYLDISTDST